MNKPRALIIGAGQIAAGYDSPGDSVCLTHAHALSSNHGVDFIGFYDVRPATAQNAANKWGIKAIQTWDEVEQINPEILVIAVPDEAHFDVLNKVLDLNPRVVLCEKPVTISYTLSKQIAEKFERKKIPLFVNYQRRFDPVVLDVKKQILDKRVGAFLGGVVAYSKGILHNGSHAVDLLRFLIGEPTGAYVGKKNVDYSSTDPTVDGVLYFAHQPIHLLAADEKFYSLFEIDLIFEKGRYRFIHSGLKYELSEVKADPVFSGYFELSSSSLMSTQLNRALSFLVDEILVFLRNPKASTLERIFVHEAIKTQWVCEQLVQQKTHQYVEFKT